VISAALNFLKRYAKIIKIAVIAIAIFAAAFFVYDYGKQKQTVDSLETTNTGLGEEIKGIKDGLEQQKKDIQAVRRRYATIRKDFIRMDERIQEFVSMPDQQILDNREKVEDQINSQLETIRNKMECESGDDEKC